MTRTHPKTHRGLNHETPILIISLLNFNLVPILWPWLVSFSLVSFLNVVFHLSHPKFCLLSSTCLPHVFSLFIFLCPSHLLAESGLLHFFSFTGGLLTFKCLVLLWLASYTQFCLLHSCPLLLNVSVCLLWLPPSLIAFIQFDLCHSSLVSLSLCLLHVSPSVGS